MSLRKISIKELKDRVESGMKDAELQLALKLLRGSRKEPRVKKAVPKAGAC